MASNSIKYVMKFKGLTEVLRTELESTVHLYYTVTGLRNVIAYSRDY